MLIGVNFFCRKGMAMALKASVDKKEAKEIHRVLRIETERINDKAVKRAARVIAKDIAKNVRAESPVVTGDLKKHVTPVVRDWGKG